MKKSNFRADKKLFGLFIIVFSVFLFPGVVSAQNQVGAAPIWVEALNDMVMAQPYLQAESVVVAGVGGSVQSFFRTGTNLWNFNPQVPITPFVARSIEGAAYFSDEAGYFRAINRVGRELWRVNLGRPITFPPVVGWDGRVFIPLGSTISCRTAAGQPLWTIDLGSPMVVRPLLDRGGSFVSVLENRDFVRVGPFSRVERIRLDQLPLLIVPLRSGGGYSFILLYPNGTAERLIYNEGGGRGDRLSRAPFPSLPGPPASASSAAPAANREGYFAVTLRDGRVMLMHESGRVVWTGDSHEVGRGAVNLDHTMATMVFDERGIYSITTRGATGFAVDGRRRFQLRFDEANAVPALSEEGILYVADRNQNLRAYMLDSRQRTVARTRYYGFPPEGSYGMGNPPPSPWSTDRARFNPIEQDYMVRRIEAAINSGQIGEREPAYVAYLMEMIGFFLNDPHFSRARPLVDPIRHIEFIMLLGRVGSRETVPFLWNIFDRYHEPSVRAASAEAIGRIGVDPYGNTFHSFNFFLAPNNPHRDPQLLLSATASIAALSRFSGPPLSTDGIRLLQRFANLSWVPRALQNQIRAEIDALFREGFVTVIN